MAVVSSSQSSFNVFPAASTWGTNYPEDQQPWREGWGSYYVQSCLSALMVDHEPLLPVVSTAVTDLYNGTFWLDHLSLLLFLLSLEETSSHQTALNPRILTSLDVPWVRKTVGLWKKLTTSFKV